MSLVKDLEEKREGSVHTSGEVMSVQYVDQE